jgi:hypothetical protein
MPNQSTLTIRLPAHLRDAFNASCESQDQTASQVLRATIRKYVAQHGQPDLLATSSRQTKPRSKRANTAPSGANRKPK